jgi:hypothetical protein
MTPILPALLRYYRFDLRRRGVRAITGECVILVSRELEC